MDVQLYADLLLGGGTILLDRTPSYRYRRHADSVTSRPATARSVPTRPPSWTSRLSIA